MLPLLRRIAAACARIRCLFRPECTARRSAQDSAHFPAQIAPWYPSAQEWGIISGAEWEIVAACAGKCPQIRPERSEAPFCAGKGRQTRPEMPDSQFCAGMMYLFLRRIGNCCRLRRKTLPNPPGLLRDTLLRRNRVSFPARNGKLLPPARVLAALPARNAPWHPSAREWGIFFCAGFLNWKLWERKRDKFYWCKSNFYHLSLI